VVVDGAGRVPEPDSQPPQVFQRVGGVPEVRRAQLPVGLFADERVEVAGRLGGVRFRVRQVTVTGHPQGAGRAGGGPAQPLRLFENENRQAVVRSGQRGGTRSEDQQIDFVVPAYSSEFLPVKSRTTQYVARPPERS
jgi:hypothetical protein